MDDLVRDVMSGQPIAIERGETIRFAAELMRDKDVGDVLVTQDGELVGILTDRDIVVRAVAAESSLDAPIGSICTSGHLAVVGPDDSIERARDLMRRRAVRRLPVVDDGVLVGVISLGDLAIEREPRSPLGRISAAAPNN